MMHSSKISGRSGGYTLIEVLVGILIFAVGMMALAQLQGNLAKSSSDANARTVAASVAEEIIESAKRFGTIGEYNAIGSGDSIPATVNRSGYTYTITAVTEDYWYDPGTQSFGTDPAPGRANSDFKKIDLTVAWNDAQQFRIDDNQSTGGGSGSITVTDMISSITSPAGGKVVLGTGGGTMYSPPVEYKPGLNPDIVSISLGDNKFKESTTPLPKVLRTDELVETSFDVVTYSNPNNGTGSTFLRREEFRSVSCECNLRIPDATTEGGLRPTIWNGEEYVEGEFVSKPYGESANNQQSGLCDLCCRDHHDGGTGENDADVEPGLMLFNPFRAASDYHSSGALAGNHKHYNRDINGNMVLVAQDGATYVEACRLVRKDGFFRVAQDLRQEGLNAFPADYLDEPAEVTEYSNYVTAAVGMYNHGTAGVDAVVEPSLLPPSLMPVPVVFPASKPTNRTRMVQGGVEEQQLRSRGIYVDFMSADLRFKIDCLASGSSGEACGVPQVSTPLEIMPFYDVQLTWLARWNETPSNNPIDVTNEAIADGNTHSRGIARLTSGFANSTISSTVHSGNLGLTGTDPIDQNFDYELERYNLYAKAEDPNAPPAMTTIRIEGEITSAVGGVRASDVEIFSADAACERTPTGYTCVLESGVVNPRIEVSNYFKKGKVLLACSAVLSTHGEEHSGDDPARNWTRFNLPDATNTVAHIVIRENSC